MKRPSVSLLMILFLLVRIHLCAANESQVAEGTLLIQNARIISMAPESSPFEGYILVGKDGRITAIGEGSPPEDVHASQRMDVERAIVAPGFISAHSHIYMSPLRGLGHDQNLYGWFKA